MIDTLEKEGVFDTINVKRNLNSAQRKLLSDLSGLESKLDSFK